ncbi:MAG: MFS transporter [Gammaproteobacteria bacterium]|nr:MFS transporter [Gammaproteobacteria bacterium]
MPRSKSSITETLSSLSVSIYLPSMLTAIGRGGALVALPLYALDQGGGPFLAALVVGLRSAGTMVSNVPSSQLAAIQSDKAVMLLGLVTMAISAIGLASFSSLAFLCGSAFLLGAGSGSWIVARLLHITESVRLEQRGRTISVMAGIERAGALIGPALAGFAIQSFGYVYVFAGIGCLFLAAFLLCLWKTTKIKVRTSSRVSIGVVQITVRFYQVFLKSGSVMLCLSYLRNARIFLIPVWGAAIGLSPSEIGLVMSLSSAIDMMMFLPAGYVLDTFGRKINLISSLVLMSCSTVVLPLAGSFVPFLVVAMIAGLGNGLGTGIVMTLGGDLSPRYGRSQFLGVWRLVGDIGGVVSPFAIGMIAQSASMLVACAFSGLFGFAGVALAFWFVPETLKKRVIGQELSDSPKVDGADLRPREKSEA